MPFVNLLLDDPTFLEFYVTANKNTYAGGDAKAETLRNGGKRYVFYDGDRWPQWRHTNIYHGHNPFFGNEIVEETVRTMPPIPPAAWMPIAQMSYDGYAMGNHDRRKQMFAFLEKNLQEVCAQSLFRGNPENAVRENGLEYVYKWERTGAFRVRGEIHIRADARTHWCDLYFQCCALR